MKNKIKGCLNKIPFKTIGVFILVILIIALFVLYRVNISIGINMIRCIIYISFFVLILLSLKIMIDDIEKLGIALIIIIWLLFFITSVGKLMINYVPSHFPTDKEAIYELYSSSFSAIFSSFIGVIGTVIGAVYGGKKALEAATEQITNQNKILQDSQNEKADVLSRFFKTFLREEIRYNFRAFGSDDFKKEWKVQFLSNEKPFPSFSYNQNHFKFDEFNSIKHEIMSTTSEISKEIIDIYVAFKMLNNIDNILNLNQEQYEFIKNIYIKNIDLY